MTLKAESRKLKSLKFEVRNPKRCPPVYFIQRNLLTSRLHSISVGQAERRNLARITVYKLARSILYSADGLSLPVRQAGFRRM